MFKALMVSVLIALPVLAQQGNSKIPIAASICEIQKAPANFDGKLVSVTAEFVPDRDFGWLIEGKCASLFLKRPSDFPSSSPYSKLRVVHDGAYIVFERKAKTQCADKDRFDCQGLRGEFTGVYYVPERKSAAQPVNGGLILISLKNVVLLPKGVIPAPIK